MSRFTAHAVACTIAVATASHALAGPLTPPLGAPSPTNKTLGHVEPRVPINADNTPGDGDSVFRITTPGSYYLTASIPPVGPGRHAIEVDTENVTIDLNGFTINGNGDETLAAIAGGFALTVRNGFIETWDDIGVTAGGSLRVERVHFDNVGGTQSIASAAAFLVAECTFRLSGAVVPADGTAIIRCRFRDQRRAIRNAAAEGVVVLDTVIDGQNTGVTEATIDLGAGAIVSRVVVSEEGQTAIRIADSGLVDRCVVTGAASGGGTSTAIVVGTNSIVSNSVVQDFGGVGISAEAGSRIEGNSIVSCAGGGIQAVTAVIAHNVLESNGGNGIEVGNACLVVHNLVRSTTGDGILGTNDNTIRGNTLDGDSIRVLNSDNIIDGNAIIDVFSNSIILESGGNLVIRNTISGGLISNIGGNTVAATATGTAAINAAGPFANIFF